MYFADCGPRSEIEFNFDIRSEGQTVIRGQGHLKVHTAHSRTSTRWPLWCPLCRMTGICTAQARTATVAGTASRPPAAAPAVAATRRPATASAGLRPSAAVQHHRRPLPLTEGRLQEAPTCPQDSAVSPSARPAPRRGAVTTPRHHPTRPAFMQK